VLASPAIVITRPLPLLLATVSFAATSLAATRDARA
jgi:hypothetical protein